MVSAFHFHFPAETASSVDVTEVTGPIQSNRQQYTDGHNIHNVPVLPRLLTRNVFVFKVAISYTYAVCCCISWR